MSRPTGEIEHFWNVGPGKFSRRHYQLSPSKTGSLSFEIPTFRRYAVWWFLRLEISGVDNKPYNLPEQFLPTFLRNWLSQSSCCLFLSNKFSISVVPKVCSADLKESATIFQGIGGCVSYNGYFELHLFLLSYGNNILLKHSRNFFNWPYVYFIWLLEYLIKKPHVPTKRAIVILIKVKSCSAFLIRYW